MSGPALSWETIAADGGLELCRPSCQRGIGRVICRTDEAALIEGVRVAPLALWPDDRGYFLEVGRAGQALLAAFAPSRIQVSASLSYPGAIKAFHYHLRQTDLWTVAAGMLQVALADLRRGSPTFGMRNTLYIGVLRPWQVLIPPGVAHGYKVIGETPALLVYVTDRYYDPDDEGRLPYDDGGINYDWELQHK
ncbi:MAG: dTDP-4-dehydrorhamnose 3,5-epimerase family protein [Bryobacterales bacterium]|nr:dTDP-4-dehydrorhamnose 3,5-epimerase family protein [Bryobacteraceae bacterium]MDW8131018.1 dTDP-4-dehydrorhamnose 3,5-epimerase family protein [Bryobacterales bacterium]